MTTFSTVFPGPTTTILADTPWMWHDSLPQTNAYVAFVRRFRGSHANITLFADSTYRVYVDGCFVNQGPLSFRKPVAVVDQYDLPLEPQCEEHVVCVFVHYFGTDTKWCLAGTPGFTAALTCDGVTVSDAKGWEVYPMSAWAQETPRISWARGFVEDIQCADATMAVLQHFAADDYSLPHIADLPVPLTPQCHPSPFTVWRPRLTPYLTWASVPIPAPPTIYRTNGEVFSINDLASRLFFEHWTPIYDAELSECRNGQDTRCHRAAGDLGWVLVYDLERICAGDISITVCSDSAATLDIAYTERCVGGKPEPTRNGSRYVSRIRVQAGETTCRLTGFHGFRYIVVSVRDNVGVITIAPPHIRECFGDLPYRDTFTSSDRLTNALHTISRRSIVLNTQATCLDCNTRELGSYWGDGVWIADLAGHMSGDFSHLKHLCYGMVDEYASTGVIAASLFGMGAPLYDYCLVPHEVMRRYYQATGDASTIRDTFATAAAILDDHIASSDADGCVRMDRLKALYQQRQQSDFRAPVLFLDHAGLGWHPRDTTGIDRSDTNAGLQCFFLQALQAMADLAPIAKTSDVWSARASALITTIRQRFLNLDTGLLADARLDNGDYVGCSQIVNALAICTGVFTDEEARRVLRTLLTIEERRDIARSTPYGWFFIADAACRLGMAAELMPILRQLYRPMLERGATATWEAWGGEIHDSLNHAWSAVQPWVNLRGLAGLRCEQPGYHQLSFTPQLFSLESCSLQAVIPQGQWQLAWTRQGLHNRQLNITVPPGVSATVHLPKGSHTFTTAWSGLVTG